MAQDQYKSHNILSQSEVEGGVDNCSEALPVQRGHTDSSARYHHLLQWRWEILSLALALGILLTIFATLVHFNGREVPRWPLTINLNTLIALLSTVFRATTLVAVAAVIGQLRWEWFLKPRPLLDLHRIDSASYSALGSIRLLLQAPKNAMILLGALITITSLAIGPFMQQSIKTFACEQHLPNLNASLPAANFLDGLYARTGAGLYDLDFSMKGTMINGLADPLGNYSTVSVFCPTGNCTFQAYAGVTHSSIGMCSSCIDTTSSVKIGHNNENTLVNFTLPSGLLISGRDPFTTISVGAESDLSWASSSFNPSFVTAASQSIVNISVLTLTSAPCSDSPSFGECSSSYTNYVVGFLGNMRPLAVSCALYPCLKNYYALVANSQLDETIVSTAPASQYIEPSDGPHPMAITLRDYAVVKKQCPIDNQIYVPGNFSLLGGNRRFETLTVDGANVSVPYECLYKFSGISAMAFRLFMGESLFSGNCAGNDDSIGVLHCPTAFWLEPFWGGGSSNITVISDTMESFATVVTNKMREVGFSLYTDINHTVNPDVLGVVNSVSVCTQFDWPWLILPTVLLVLSILLLISIVVGNYKWYGQPVWKSSSLPLVFYGFTNDAAISDKLDKDQLEEIAKHTYVQFRTDRVTGFERVTLAVDMMDADSLMMEESGGNGNYN
ncbi:hypothetical protein F5884DRAFT_776755 [Xylogone sp. PMI_703]|nr:hypothetical protein F5884DRAFT_776755 [Xylogone sp. PMI_703]